jgi:cytochrome c-type biogenesis protein CcmH/NrfG
MDEPTVPEMLRALQADVHRILAIQEQYVTKEIMDLRLEALTKDQAEDRARLDAMSRWLWSGVVAPVIVGIILYVLLGKGP